MADLPDEFYTIVGRAVVRTAELEAQLSRLLMLMLHGPPTAGKVGDEAYRAEYRKWTSNAGTAVVGALRKAIPTPFPWRTELETYLDQCMQALDERHGVAHSVWVALGDDDWLGSRSLRPAKKSAADPGPDSSEVRASEAALADQHDRLTRLVQQAWVWWQRIEVSRREP